MQPPQSPLTFWYQKPITWIVFGILACAAILALPMAQRFYRAWTGERKVQRAADALARGDHETAILHARGALATNDKNLEALRILAKVAETVGSPQALDFRRQIEVIDPKDGENRLGLAETNLRAGNLTAAENSLEKVAATAQDSVRYHEIAAAIASVRGDLAKYELHIEAAARLAPGEDSYPLKLAIFRLNSKSQETRAKALVTLEQLKEKPVTALAALRALLRDAFDRNETDRVIQLADAVASAPGATVGDKLTRLSAIDALINSPNKTAFASKNDLNRSLDELQRETSADPAAVAQVLAWMNAHNLALQVPEWVASLPPDVASNPAVSIALADSHALASDWPKLKGMLVGVTWDKLEFLRFAYLSRACERLQDDSSSIAAWRRALELSESEQSSLEGLARLGDRWGWNDRTEEVLWKLTDGRQCPRWVADALWIRALKNADSAVLFKVSKLMLQYDPKSVTARTNFARLAFICGQDETQAHRTAETLYKENGSDAAVVTTYGLSLFRQGHADAAVATLAKLTPRQLEDPMTAYLYGLFLAAAGQPDEASEFIQRSSKEPLFPEMESVRQMLASAFKARKLEQEGSASDSRTAWLSALAEAKARADSLELLAKAARKWGWEDRMNEIIDELAGKGICPAWATSARWEASLKSGNSSKIYQAAKQVFDTNPNSFEAKNNFITVALLAGRKGDEPDRLAEALHAENPASVDATATLALSLYKRGNLDKALAILRTLSVDQRRAPRPARLEAIVLASLGENDEAERALQMGATGPLLPEEKQVVDALQTAFRWHMLQAKGDDSAETAWKQAMVAAERRPETLETLARMLFAWQVPQRAVEVLWKRREFPDCPRWAIDALWMDSLARRDAGKLYELSRYLRRAEPENVKFRNEYVRLSLLTGKDTDSPHRIADTLMEENPGNPEVATTAALSLLQRKKTKEAIAILETLKPAELRNPRVAYYYGVVLTAGGQSAKATEYLRIGSETPLLAEEVKLLTKLDSASAANAAP